MDLVRALALVLDARAQAWQELLVQTLGRTVRQSARSCAYAADGSSRFFSSR
jgi:hypothetical protein